MARKYGQQGEDVYDFYSERACLFVRKVLLTRFLHKRWASKCYFPHYNLAFQRHYESFHFSQYLRHAENVILFLKRKLAI